MGKQLTIEDFINRSKLIHGDTYDYSKSEYIGIHNKIKIICFKHDEFEQIANNHLKGCGCPKCKNENTAAKQTLSKEQFIEKAKKRHGNKYNYDFVEHKSLVKKVTIICPIHGKFKQRSGNHLHGWGCNSCGLDSSSQKQSLLEKDFVERAKVIHDETYDYSKIKYINMHTKIDIVCKTHGMFSQNPNNHLHGHRCPRCAPKGGGGFWTRVNFKKVCKKESKLAQLYLVELHDKHTNEKFYKIGITSNALSIRMQGIPYTFKQEIVYYNEDSDVVFNLEKTLHKLLKKYKYRPLKDFGGQSECFVLCNEVSNEFKNHIKFQNETV
jgi:hypothetical protein